MVVVMERSAEDVPSSLVGPGEAGFLHDTIVGMAAKPPESVCNPACSWTQRIGFVTYGVDAAGRPDSEQWSRVRYYQSRTPQMAGDVACISIWRNMPTHYGDPRERGTHIEVWSNEDGVRRTARIDLTWGDTLYTEVDASGAGLRNTDNPRPAYDFVLGALQRYMGYELPGNPPAAAIATE